MKILRLMTAVIFFSIPTVAPLAATSHNPIAQPGDPARWYQSADTPRRKYENSMKEARAALAEALAECRSQRSGRRSCETEAHESYRHDVSYAKAFLRNSRTLADSSGQS